MSADLLRGSALTALPQATLRALSGLEARTHAERVARLRQAGHDGGEELAAAFERAMEAAGDSSPEQLSLEDFNSGVSEYFEALGWGRLTISSLHDVVAAVDVTECWEAKARGSTANPSCHITTGLLAAFFTRFAPYQLATLEVECASAGHQHCRFLLGQPEVLGEVYGLISGGLEYSAALSQLSGVSASA